MAVLSDATQVAADVLPAHPLATREVRGRSFSSPDATVGGGFISRSIEMGDLQRNHPIIELIRNAMAKGGEKYGGRKCRRGETTYAIGWLKWGPN
jgi:hypothetical protein